MTRLAILGLLAGIAALLTLACSSVPSPPGGVKYSDRAMGVLTIGGLRLGMTSKEAESVLAARGFTPDGAWWRKTPHITSSESWEFILPRYLGDGDGGDLFSITYRRVWSPDYYRKHLQSEEARREVLSELIGEPTSWERTSDIDRFFLARNVEDGVRQRTSDVQSCFWSWGCASIRDNLDCRPIVKRARVPVADGVFRGSAELYIEFTDYGMFADKLLSDRSFRNRDLTGPSCLPALVH